MGKKNKKKQTPHIRPDDLKGVTLRQVQKTYMKTILENKITICYGPAGTSKTFSAVYTALKLLADDQIGKIILTKPIQESGEKLGYLPGDIRDKIDPFMESFLSNMDKIVGEDTTRWLITTGQIEFRPLAYMRGATFDDCIMILDEAQNADFRQLVLFITRMAKTSKALIMGDISQFDIASNKVALPDFAKMIEGIKGVGTHVFQTKDIVRDPILIEITDRYEKWKKEQEERLSQG